MVKYRYVWGKQYPIYEPVSVPVSEPTGAAARTEERKYQVAGKWYTEAEIKALPPMPSPHEKALGIEPPKPGERYIEREYVPTTGEPSIIRIPESKWTPGMKEAVIREEPIIGTRTYRAPPPRIEERVETPWREIKGLEKVQAAVRMGEVMAERGIDMEAPTPTFGFMYERVTPEGIEYQVKPKELVAYEKEVEFLRRVRKEDPRVYQVGVWGSAMAEGLTGVGTEVGRQVFGLGAERIGRVTKEERAEDILFGAAKRRTRWYADPIGVSGRAFVSEVGMVGISAGLGVGLVGLGAVAPRVAPYAVTGLKLVGVGIVAKEMYAPIVSGDPFEIGGKVGGLAVAARLSYVGFKAGIKYGLREQYLRELPAVKAGEVSLKEVRAELKLAEAAGKLGRADIRPLKDVIGETEIMKLKGGKVGRVTQDILEEWPGRKVIGGSMAARTQLKSKMPGDIDIYAEDVTGLRKFATQKYLEAGIGVTRKGGGISLGKEKLMDINPMKMLTGKQYYGGTRLTPEGFEVMKVETQFSRKVLGKYEEPFKLGRVAKDIPDFEKMARSVIRTGTVKAEESPLGLRQFRAGRVETFKQIFKDVYGKKGYVSYKAPEFKVGVVALPVGLGYERAVVVDPFKAFVGYPKPKKARAEPAYAKDLEPFKDFADVPARGYPRGRDPFRGITPGAYPGIVPTGFDIGIPYRPTVPKELDIGIPYKTTVRGWPEFEVPRWGRARRPRKRRKIPVRRRFLRRRFRYTPTILGMERARGYGITIPRAPKFVGVQAVGIRPPVGRKRKKPKKRTDKKRKRAYNRIFEKALGL